MLTVILSGGSGSRLWPISRDAYPKQFCEFFDKSFLRDTIDRLQPFGAPQIVTLSSMESLTRTAYARAEHVFSDKAVTNQIILEPMSKNTAPAIALVAYLAQLSGKAEEVLGVFPADHLITRIDYFRAAVIYAEQLAAKNCVVTIGIEPRYAATGYGYLELADNLEEKVSEKPDEQKQPGEKLKAFSVKNFIEKPDLAHAEQYLQSKKHFWNAGIYFFKVRKIIELFQTYMPDLWKKIETIKPDLSNLNYVYANIVSESIDYGVMEKAKGEIVCIPGDFGWSDVGSWDELARLQEENLKLDSQARVVQNDANENFVYANYNKVIGLSGVDKLIVVDTPDALLITQRGASQDVKKLVELMRESHTPQVSEHIFEVRPWGKFEVLADRADHKVKRLTVGPGQQLSYQVHKKRDESWIVISGEAEITLEDQKYILRMGQQIFAPKGSKHRITNRGREPLVIIEIQTGAYFGEDDITRFEDDYKRV